MGAKYICYLQLSIKNESVIKSTLEILHWFRYKVYYYLKKNKNHKNDIRIAL